MKTFIVLVKSGYIRDAQIYIGKDYDNPPDSESWEDFCPSHYVGIFKAINENEALMNAAEDSGWETEILEAIEIM